MKYAMILTLLAGLAACGADGEPITPSAKVNLGVGANGVTARSNVGVTKGPVSIFVGL